jgi:TRAP-type uncharacterized transport system substrate-binding protein
MEREQVEGVALGAGLLAIIVAILTGNWPRWLRVVLVLGLATLSCGAAFYAYRYYSRPTTLTVAAGSLDGDAPQLLSAIATRMASTGAPVRLKVIDKGNVVEAAKAFAAGEADLAITRADVGDLSSAETVVVVTRGVVLLLGAPGGNIDDIDDLKGKTIGVVAADANRKLTEVLTREYDLTRAQTQFKDITVPGIPQAFKAKQISALLVVLPLSEKYLTLLRNLFPKSGKQKPTLVAIESAGAIAAVTKYYQSYDLPKGTLQGSPPIPDDDMKTLRVPFYLVANKKLSNDVVAALAKSIMDARRDLIGEYPLLAQVSEPDTDKSDSDNDTYIPIHPGAAAYFGGDEKTFFDKYGDQIFYGSMLLGTITSAFAAAWNFMTAGKQKPEDYPLNKLYALTQQINRADSDVELAAAEGRIDEILKGELEKQARGSADASEMAALGLATRRLEHLIAQRRLTLVGKTSLA